MRESKMMLSSGTLPSPQIGQLAMSHPFVQQIDVIFPSDILPDQSLTSLQTTYSQARFTLCELYDYACHLPIQSIPFKALPLHSDPDDTWCIDPRGILTLCISKLLYEKLGLVGKKMPFRGSPEQYAVGISLKKETQSVAVRKRQREALEVWDRIRVEQGIGKWNVAYAGVDPATSAAGQEGHTINEVKASARHEIDVHVPHFSDLTESAEECLEDRQERMSDIFEWIGMACLGAQRLKANNRVDPYVAVYEPPSPSPIDNITHLRWTGLMDTNFVRSLIDTTTSILSTSQSSGDNSHFISIVMHSNLMTPVAYIPEAQDKEAPLRVPGLEGEDTVCLALSNTSGRLTWAIVQSIGKWDARWG